MTPLLVDGVHRGGTTLMMHLLATSPQVAFDRVFPYEQRYFSYLVEWCSVVERPGWDRDLWNTGSANLPGPKHGLVGPIPWASRSPLTDSPPGEPSLASSLFRQVWVEFSLRAVANREAGSNAAHGEIRYYAEKRRSSLRGSLLDVVPEPAVLSVVRDPRDVWLSSRAWAASRAGSEDDAGPSPEQTSLHDFLDKSRRRLGRLARRSGPARPFRYEDLVLDPGAVAARLERELRIEVDTTAIATVRDEGAERMTSPSPQASVGRWQREMDGATAQRFRDGLGAELRDHGYEA